MNGDGELRACRIMSPFLDAMTCRLLLVFALLGIQSLSIFVEPRCATVTELAVWVAGIGIVVALLRGTCLDCDSSKETSRETASCLRGIR
jgi:hypothetical protein